MGNHGPNHWSNVRSGTLAAAMQNFCVALGDEAQPVLAYMASQETGLANRMAGFAFKDATEIVRSHHYSCQAAKLLKIWKIIKIERALSGGQAYKKAILDAGMKVSSWASDLLLKGRLKLDSCVAGEFDLVLATVEELGFKEDEDVSYDQICNRVKELGGELCPNEVAILLRIHYPDQPQNERVTLVMDLVEGQHGCLYAFVVGRDDNSLWLSVVDCGKSHTWFGKHKFAFIKPRK